MEKAEIFVSHWCRRNYSYPSAISLVHMSFDMSIMECLFSKTRGRLQRVKRSLEHVIERLNFSALIGGQEDAVNSLQSPTSNWPME